MNVFISIIEEAYVSTKMKNQNHWIYSYLKIDPKYVELKELAENSPEANIKIHGKVNDNKKQDIFAKHDKQQRKILSDVKSKNILREIISENNDKRKTILKKDDIGKKDIEKSLEIKFNKVNFIIIVYVILD
jgi:hypothetical protein